MNNNEAVLATLQNVRPIDGADKIVLADVCLDEVPITQVVVGSETVDGQVVVYFDSNMCLSDIVIRDYPSLATYLAKGNRVRCVKLRGVISNGLCVPVDYFLKYADKNIPASFTKLGSTEICYKYVPEVKQHITGSKEHKVKKQVPDTFHFHIDTAQLMRNIHAINPTDVISISRKVHGTSAIFSYLSVKRSLTFIEKCARLLGAQISDKEYVYLPASRSVVKNTENKDDLWVKVGMDNLAGKLHKGETVYYEIVGYKPGTSSFIQKNYDYGCKVGQCAIAVYRITYTNEDGDVFEYGWKAMQERCEEIGVASVQEYFYGKAMDFCEMQENWNIAFAKKIKDTWLERDCLDNLCKKMPDEGVVIRIESKDIRVFKYKSESFILGESIAKDKGEVDTEEEA